ncbi:hypothetical protein DFH06DRAFT_1307142 [Mycena polygramma]|nr:hypothetical protein DFH06DRAFT_1307142 [Mycena polygramma]
MNQKRLVSKTEMPLADGIALRLLTPTMDDLEKGTPPRVEETDHSVQDIPERIKPAKVVKDNPEHEAAAAKLWAVYVSEAEKYDRGLVESWKSDMEGMLIFAGLFSVSLTAFLIESYKTLNPDSGETTVLLLAQISQQLAASADGTAFHIPPAVPFTPPRSSLVCNTLWFISLGLSLTCALIATLLEQWARDFLHRADMRSAPVVRARVFSFLYYGLKRFKMHAVVEIIPLLLHMSLFLFFVGLVAFLLPVNFAVTVVVGIILGTVTVIYTLLTLLPLIHLDCPYRTPLSRGFWTLCQRVQTMLGRWHIQPAEPVTGPEDTTMVETVFRKAIEPSPHRSRRDTQALVWTVKSLADDNELEPFIEAIPDVIWAADSVAPDPAGRRRYVYDEPMRRLGQDPNVQLFRRLRAFEDSCFSGLLMEEVQVRRQMCVQKAKWALGCLSAPGDPAFLPLRPALPFWEQPRDLPPAQGLLCTISANAVVRWANMRAAQPLLDETLARLRKCMMEITGSSSNIPDLTLVLACLSKLTEYYIYPPGVHLAFPENNASSTDALLWEIHAAIQYIQALPFILFFNYLSDAATTNVVPYRFEVTRFLVRPDPTTKIPQSVEFRSTLLAALEPILRTHMNLFQSDEHEHWLDDVFRTILSYWEPAEDEPLPWVLLDYINTRGCPFAVRHLVAALSEGAWKAIPLSISSQARPAAGNPGPTFGTASAMNYWTSSLTAVWTLLSVGPPPQLPVGIRLSVCKQIIHSVPKTRVPSLSSSLIAMAKSRFFRTLASATLHMDRKNIISSFNDPYFPAETSMPTPAPEEAEQDLSLLRQLVYCRCTEAELDTLSEYIECCCSGDLPYKAIETVARIGTQHMYTKSTIHPPISSGDSADKDRLGQTVINVELFAVYAPDQNGAGLHSFSFKPWLDDSDARKVLKGALINYLARLPPTDTEYTRIQEVVINLDTLHAQQADGATDHSSESERDKIHLDEDVVEDQANFAE